MLSPKTQYNLRNAKCYFEEHLSVGDYYAEYQRGQGEWLGQGTALLGLSGKVTRDVLLDEHGLLLFVVRLFRFWAIRFQQIRWKLKGDCYSLMTLK